MSLPYKFIVSGSGRVGPKERVHESLAGRKAMFEVFPVSFHEFVNFKTGYKYDGKLADYFSVENKRTLGFLEEYLNFGGYPRVVIEDAREEKNKIISEIYRSYIEKDIAYLLKVEKSEIIFGIWKKLLLRKWFRLILKTQEKKQQKPPLSISTILVLGIIPSACLEQPEKRMVWCLFFKILFSIFLKRIYCFRPQK